MGWSWEAVLSHQGLLKVSLLELQFLTGLSFPSPLLSSSSGFKVMKSSWEGRSPCLEKAHCKPAGLVWTHPCPLAVHFSSLLLLSDQACTSAPKGFNGLSIGFGVSHFPSHSPPPLWSHRLKIQDRNGTGRDAGGILGNAIKMKQTCFQVSAVNIIPALFSASGFNRAFCFCHVGTAIK